MEDATQSDESFVIFYNGPKYWFQIDSYNVNKGGRDSEKSGMRRAFLIVLRVSQIQMN